MPASAVSLEHAKTDKLFYVVANVVIYRPSDGRCLILKRSATEKVHPGRYCVPGGKLEWSQLDPAKPTRINGDVRDFENALGDLLVREVQEEAGVTIEPGLRYLNNVAFIRPDGIPVVLLKFAARYSGGEVRVEAGAFEGHAWVDAEEVKNYECIDGVPAEVAEAIAVFSAV